MDGSKRFTLDRNDLKKIFTGALIAVGGAALVSLADQIQLLSDQYDFGAWEVISVALAQTAVNLIRKFVTDHTGPH